MGSCRSFIFVYVPGAGLPDARASAFPVPHGPGICQDRATWTAPVWCLDPICSSATEQEKTFFIQVTSVLLSYNCGKTVNTKAKIRIAAGNVIIADFGQIYHRDWMERSSAATASISTPAGSFNSAPRYWI